MLQGELPVYRFLSVLLSEQLPTFAILMFFRHVPRRRTGQGSSRLPPALYNSIHNINGTGGSGSQVESSKRISNASGGFLFANPQRYDSDDEDDNANSKSYGGKSLPGPMVESYGAAKADQYGLSVKPAPLTLLSHIDKTSQLQEVASSDGSYQRLGKSLSSGGRSHSSKSRLMEQMDDDEYEEDADLISTPEPPTPHMSH